MDDKAKGRMRVERLEAELLKSKESLRVCEHARKSVRDLVRLAKGEDKLAVTLLGIIASGTVSALNSIAEQRPHLILPLSRHLFAWPAFISHKRAFKLENEKLMATLQLGEGGFYSKRGWQLSAPSTRFALRLYLESAATTAKRPLFTRKTKKQWFEKNWNALLKEGFKPEESELLAPLGKSKATKKPKYCKNLRKATQDANVRAEIKAKVWKAFDKLFGHLESK
jgi:hypothetical protein